MTACREGKAEPCTATVDFAAAAWCSGDSKETWQHTGNRSWSKGDKGKQPSGIWGQTDNRHSAGQRKGSAAVSGSKNSAVYRVSTPSPVACTGLVPLTTGLRKIPCFSYSLLKNSAFFSMGFVHLPKATTARGI